MAHVSVLAAGHADVKASRQNLVICPAGTAAYMPISNKFGSCASGSVVAPIIAANSFHHGGVAAELAARLARDPFLHFDIEASGMGRRSALNGGIGRKRNGA